MLHQKETLILYIYVRYIIQTQHIWSPLSPNLEPTHSSYIGTYGQSADFLIVLKKETKCTHQLVDLGEEDLLIQGNNRKVREELKGGLLAKSGKLIFQGRSFLEGKVQKKWNLNWAQVWFKYWLHRQIICFCLQSEGN